MMEDNTLFRLLITILLTMFPLVVYKLTGGLLKDLTWFTVCIWIFNGLIQGIIFGHRTGWVGFYNSVNSVIQHKNNDKQ